MKRRLNILTFLILFALGVHTGYTFFYSWDELSTSCKEGFKNGREQANDAFLSPAERKKLEKEEAKTTCNLYLKKKEGSEALLDSVPNAITGTYIPAKIKQMDVRIADKAYDNVSWLFGLSAIVVIPFVLAVFVLFLKLITSIKSADIFTYGNVWRLRWMGISLAVIGGIYTLGNYVELAVIRSSVSILGYEITGENMIEFSSFVNALIAFLAAEVFALGLKLKEEQELTI